VTAPAAPARRSLSAEGPARAVAGILAAAALAAVFLLLAGRRLGAQGASYDELHQADGAFRWLDAGHPYPLLFHPGGAIEEIGAPALPLGVRAASAPATGDARLGAGDLLVLYSDGLVEARSPSASGAGEEFGFDRLEESLARHADRSVEGLRDGVLADVQRFAGNGPREDDQTILVLRLPAA